MRSKKEDQIDTRTDKGIRRTGREGRERLKRERECYEGESVGEKRVEIRRGN